MAINGGGGVDLEGRAEVVMGWIDDHLGRWHPTDSLTNGPEIYEEDGQAEIKLHTKRYEYGITIAEDYLGCIATCRCWEPGEQHHRGNDLHDGDFSRETWRRIMRDILAHELVEVTKK